MDEIICPQCAHSNPIDAVFCERCGALLPPARPATEPLPPTLRPGEEPVKKSTSELEPLLPAWLRESRQSQSEPPSPPREEKPTPPPPPDPLAALSASESEEEIPDWLKELGIVSEKPSPPSEELQFEWEEKGEEEETLLPEGDWLQNLGSIPSESSASGGSVTSRDVGAQPEATPAPSPLTPGELPEWLQDVAPETPPPAGEEGVPDWLKSFAEESLPPAAEPTPAAPAGEEDVPDWLKAFAEPSPPPAAEPTPATPAGEEDVPDWLKGFAEEPLPPTAEPTPATPAGEEDVPDWLKGFAEEPLPPTAEPTPATPAGEESVPDWLKTFAEPSPPPTAQPTPATPAGEEDVPDWLKGFAEEPLPPTAEPTPATPAGEESAPDWLKAFAEPLPPSAAEPTPAAPAGEESVPDWLKTFAEPSPPLTAEPTPATPAMIGTPGSEEGDIGALLEMEIPDWLSGISAEAAPTAAPAEETPALASAELPAWVQAMRPIEAILVGGEKGTEVQEEEKEGPLAGLRGVLPAAPTPLPYSRPRTYSIRLNLTPAQQTHVQILEQLIAEEGQPRPRRIVTPPSSPRLLRWLITVLLLIALVIPLFGQTQITAMPELVPQETWQFIQSFNSLPPSPKILFVLDYEVATSGEIEALILPSLQHLNSITQANLAFLALNPLNVTMAQRLLDVLHTTQPQAPLPPMLNLGYLPGGISALPLFAAAPSTTISEAVRAEWLESPFRTVNTLADFDRVVLVTDHAENARTWIEQTAPWRPHLLIVSSARSTPMLLPYFYAGQVQGIIGNLNAAAAYEHVNGIPALGRAYRDAYSAGLLLALVIGFAGFLWGLITHRAHSQPQEKEA